MPNYKITYLGSGKFQIQENKNGRFGKSQTVDLGEQFIANKSFEEIMSSLKETLEDISPEELEKLYGTSQNKIDESENDITDSGEEWIKIVGFIKGVMSKKTFIIVSIIVIIAITLTVLFLIKPIKKENKIQKSEIELVSDRIIELEKKRLNELKYQKKMRLEIELSKSRVSGMDKESLNLKSQEIVLSNEIMNIKVSNK